MARIYGWVDQLTGAKVYCTTCRRRYRYSKRRHWRPKCKCRPGRVTVTHVLKVGPVPENVVIPGELLNV